MKVKVIGHYVYWDGPVVFTGQLEDGRICLFRQIDTTEDDNRIYAADVPVKDPEFSLTITEDDLDRSADEVAQSEGYTYTPEQIDAAYALVGLEQNGAVVEPDDNLIAEVDRHSGGEK